MITIDTEKSTTTDIHFLIKIENPLIEDGDKETQFVNNKDNINNCLDLFIRKYSPFSGLKEYSDELVRLNLLANEFDFKTELMKFDEKTTHLRFNSECVSNFEKIVNEQYRIWNRNQQYKKTKIKL